MANRTRGYIRKQRARVIRRKNKIAETNGWVAKHPGTFAKGKVHCSCYMCSGKTEFHGMSLSDLKKHARDMQKLGEEDWQK